MKPTITQQEHSLPSSDANTSPWAFYFLMGTLVLGLLCLLVLGFLW